MDALLFAGEWQHKQSTREDGRFPLIDEIQDVAKQIAPDWHQYSITRTTYMGSNSRFVTPYEHPVCSYGATKTPVFEAPKEIDGHPGVFELTYNPALKPVLGTRLAATPKDPARKLFHLEGFEAAGPKKPSKKKAEPAGDGDE